MSDPKQLLSLVERLENLDEQNRTLNEDRKEILLEAKSNSWDPKMVKAVVAYRRDPEAAENRSTRLDEYLALLGSSGSPKNLAPAATVTRLRATLEEPSRAGARATQPVSSQIPIDAGADGSPRHVAAPAPLTRPPPAPGAGSSFAEPDPRDDIRNQPFYRGAVS